MRKDTRFHRSERQDIESKLPPGTLSDSQAVGIWNMMLQADDPGEVARWYRSYRDSKHCTTPRHHLRSMRDTMIADMREQNKKDPKKRVEKKTGVNIPTWWDSMNPRKGA